MPAKSINQKKSELQDEMANYLVDKGNLVLQWATGVGKSRVAVNAVVNLLSKCEENFKVLLVVAETAHKDNWRQEFKDVIGSEQVDSVLSHVEIICYASLKNWRDVQWNLIIFDEAHHLGSDMRAEILQNFKAERVLALSATIKDEVMAVLTQSFGVFKRSRISFQEAIDLGFLPEPKIICIPLELERFDRTEVLEIDFRTKKSTYKGTINDLWSNRWNYLKKKLSYSGNIIQFSCTQKEKYEYINEQFEYYKRLYFRQQGNKRLKNMWLQWGNKRKRFLGELKTKKAEELCSHLKEQGKRFICFCSSVLQAEALGGEDSIHSKRKDSLKIISEFNEGKRDSIFAVGMLQEGQNLTNIQAGIIVQLDGEERGFVQKFGRSLRADDPVQYIFYYKNTRDEEYLKKALENINSDYILEE